MNRTTARRDGRATAEDDWGLMRPPGWTVPGSVKAYVGDVPDDCLDAWLAGYADHLSRVVGGLVRFEVVADNHGRATLAVLPFAAPRRRPPPKRVRRLNHTRALQAARRYCGGGR